MTKLKAFLAISFSMLFFSMPSYGFHGISHIIISGKVSVSPDEVPADGAKVVLFHAVRTFHLFYVSVKYVPVRETMTGHDGSYLFEVPLDNYMLELESRPCAWNAHRKPLPKSSFKGSSHVIVNIRTTVEVLACRHKIKSRGESKRK